MSDTPVPASIELIGHAALRIEAEGKRLLLDPWFFEPIDGNATFHWPPLVHSLDELAATTDAIWISHVHPDHLDPRTLQRFPAHVPVYIGEYANKGFRDSLRALGRDVRELPFQQPARLPGTPFTVCLLESDYDESAAYDSAIVVQAPGLTVFNNNDCFLAEEKYRWVAARYAIDVAFLGYSPASYYPVCFEFEPADKARRLQANAERRYNDFLAAARLLSPRRCVPFAMGIRFMHPEMLWQNVQFNRAQEAVRRARAAGFAAEALWPGDRIDAAGALQRRGPDMDEAAEDRALADYAAGLGAHVEAIWDAEPAARPGIVAAFRDFMLGLWAELGPQFPEVRDTTIAYRLRGPQATEFHFDFSREPGDIFRDGPAPRFDMRYTYPDKLLQRRLDGEIDWDELHFSNRVSVGQNRYSSAFYAMLRHHENSRHS
jgi:UDP-MurNAc hydroxylase